jgi:hypothetical protein
VFLTVTPEAAYVLTFEKLLFKNGCNLKTTVSPAFNSIDWLVNVTLFVANAHDAKLP